MGFERGKKFGTPTFTEKEMYEKQKAYNKYLWDNNINNASGNVEQKGNQSTKTSGFGIR